MSLIVAALRSVISGFGVVMLALGSVFLTSAAKRLNWNVVDAFLHRHASYDWSEMYQEDIEIVREAKATGGNIFSYFQLDDTDWVWFETSSDRKFTRVSVIEWA